MKTYIAIPCLDQIDVEFAKSLGELKRDYDNSSVNYATSSLVYDSRDTLARLSIEANSDYVLWLDSDMVFDKNLLENLMKTMNNENADLVCGIFFARRPNYLPCVWNKLRVGETPDENEIERVLHVPTKPFEIEGCGMAATLVKTDVLKAVIDECGTAFSPLKGFGEDVSFCIRMRKLGYKLCCDPAVKVGHVAKTVITQATYEAYNRGVLNGDT